MTDELVGFEVAKLAKEKGFQEYCYCWYDKDGVLHKPYLENGSSTDLDFRVDLDDLADNYNYEYNYHNPNSAPAQSLLQRWLREKHGIHINIWFNTLTEKYRDDSPYKHAQGGPHEDSEYGTYEEALEEGLLTALKLIK